VKFLAKLLVTLTIFLLVAKIDSERILITGFSNGASMAFRLGAELSHRPSAIAPVAGTCWIEKAEPSKALSLCYLSTRPLQR
jgi:poly(3-hydroxybutyrate) depolymerase